MDADAHVEPRVAVTLQHTCALEPAFGQQSEPGAHRPFGIVFFRALGAEHREQAVAGVLQDPAAMRLDDRGAAREETVDDGLQVFGVELAR